MKTKKEEAIRKAYGINFEKYNVTENGYSIEDNSAFYPNIEWHPGISQLWRPLELKGIETNNGWIKIESEEDFPTENSGLYFVYDGNDVGIARMSTILFRCLTSNEVYSDVTHYQPIVKPENPVY